MLRLAAQSADVVSISRNFMAGSTPQAIAEDVSMESTQRKIALLREHGVDRFAELELHVLVVSAGVGAEADQMTQELSATRAVTEAAVKETPEHLLARDTAEMAAYLLDRRERTGISYYSFRDVHLDAVLPLVRLLAGT